MKRALALAVGVVLWAGGAWARVGIVVGPLEGAWARAVGRLLPAKILALAPWEEVGVWGGDRAGALVGPGVVARIRHRQGWKELRGGVLGRGLTAAVKWAGREGQVVVICPGGRCGRLPEGVGLQVVVAGPGPGPSAYTGAVHPARRLRMLGPALTRAIRWATSGSRLVVLAHDENNRPLHLRWIATGPGRCQGLSGKALAVAPGAYRIKWAGLGGPRLPAVVRVGPGQVRRVWAGGWGKVVATGRGEASRWKATVVSLRTGRRAGGYRRLPASWRLPAGAYLLRVLAPPLSWRLEVHPGKILRLAVGRPGRVVVELEGCKQQRVGLVAVQRWAGGRTIPGSTAVVMRLVPGAYTLRLKCLPEVRLQLNLAPGARARLRAPALGWIGIPRMGGGAWWITRGPRRLGVVGPGRGVWVVPGQYRLVSMDGTRGLKVRVGPCERVLVNPSLLH